ncbi:AsmA-like C-terminal region-containing protein [Hymenobacter jejuensis]|uniref:Uncharacterized protein n=1 Tax=Hymenobacter jejuensis TaxID=2502781 RepID=A0A5B7ZXT6_9BACT|nr:AsmA-like C-terminal region-containing protein [Hymenobacter jejuensis]QDA59991.1 hypothetical protein FHG12_07635 [Hymenobacter jejuensis]
MLGGAAVGIWLGQDQIIRLFVEQVNRYLRTPVRVGKIELSLFDQFPRVSVTLRDVVVTGSLPQDTIPLARVRALYCAFDAWDIVAGRYRIRSVTVADGTVQVRLNTQAVPNYDVIRYDTTSTSEQPFALDLEKIRVKNVAVVYADASRQQRYTVQAQDLRAALAVTDTRIDIQAEGATHVQAIELGNDAYFRDKELKINTKLAIDRPGQRVAIEPSDLQVGQATYRVKGKVGYAAETDLDLRLDGKNTDVQSIISLLPPRMARHLSAYCSQGDVYFGGTVRGLLSSRHNPRLDFRFGCRDASFYHPEFKQTVEHVFLTGSFDNGAQNNVRTAVLALQNVRGKLQGRDFSGSLRYANFQDPTVNLDLRADLDVARALRFYPLASVRSASGDAQLAIQLTGNLREFRAHPATASVQSAGEVVLRNVSLRLRDLNQPFTGLTGNFTLRRNDIAVSGFSGHLGRSDFQANGLLRNALAWMLLQRQQLLIEAKIASNLLDFDQLLRGQSATVAGRAGSGGEYEFHVQPDLALNINAAVRHVRFRRFRGRALHGTIQLRNQVISSPSLSIAAAGGQASVRGTIDARQPNLIKVSTTASCTQLPLDSLFYVFEDFGQNFITAKHLRGALTATVESDVYLDRRLNPLTDRLEAEVRATVRNGELNNFEPLQKLSMVASKAQLRHLRFAELTNNFYIQSRTVYLPDMDIRSNVRTASLIRVTGTHTFDQQMDYHLSIPLLPGVLHRPGTAGAAPIGPTILLAIQGDEDNFSVRYDRARAQANRGGAMPARTKSTIGDVARPDNASADASAAAPAAVPASAPKPFELKKPVKKPAQPQTGEYFDF